MLPPTKGRVGVAPCHVGPGSKGRGEARGKQWNAFSRNGQIHNVNLLDRNVGSASGRSTGKSLAGGGKKSGTACWSAQEGEHSEENRAKT